MSILDVNYWKREVATRGFIKFETGLYAGVIIGIVWAIIGIKMGFIHV